MKQLGIALALLFFACWFGQSSAQCACNDTACINTAVEANPNTQMCCNWIAQPVETNATSLVEPGGTPLGFLQLEYRGTDSNRPDLCVQVSLPRGNIRYVVAAVESDSNICIQQRNPGPDDEPTCGSGGVFFCQSFSSSFGNNVELEFSCNVGQGSCPVNDEDFFFKPTVTALDTDDEYFCDNINRTLPNSLVNSGPDPSDNPNPPPLQTDGAVSVVSLLQPALLLVILLATLFFH